MTAAGSCNPGAGFEISRPCRIVREVLCSAGGDTHRKLDMKVTMNPRACLKRDVLANRDKMLLTLPSTNAEWFRVGRTALGVEALTLSEQLF